MSEASGLTAFKRVLLGRPIPSRLAHHERLSKTTGLAVLSSDALSSVAYATEEIVRTLILAGTGALWLVTPIGAVITTLLIVVALSYRQTIHAYPGGGGAYIVAKENIGDTAGLVAGAALLIDYVLTVAVSVAAGVAAVTSAFPFWYEHRVALSLAFVALITVGNLRGVRESGRIFAAPTYFFLAAMLALLGGRRRAGPHGHRVAGPRGALGPPAGHGRADHLPGPARVRQRLHGHDGRGGDLERRARLQAARGEERGRHAHDHGRSLRRPCSWARRCWSTPTRCCPATDETVVSQLARAVFGGRGIAYYAVQAATALILILAANTAFQDFPRLASVMARDRFLPDSSEPGRPAGVLQRHHGPGGFAAHPDRGVPGRHPRPHPALHGRRVRLVLALPGRDVPEVAPRAVARLAPPRPAQRVGRDPDDDRPGRGRGHQVRRGRVAHRRPDPDPRAPLPRRPPPLRQRGRPAEPQGMGARRAAAQHGGGADQRHAPRRRAGPAVRAEPQRRRARRLRGGGPGRNGEDPGGLGDLGRRAPSSWSAGRPIGR